jgi:hypothetical protein
MQRRNTIVTAFNLRMAHYRTEFSFRDSYLGAATVLA